MIKVDLMIKAELENIPAMVENLLPQAAKPARAKWLPSRHEST
jgi:hypothetical protein